jgi:hypothetical protein
VTAPSFVVFEYGEGAILFLKSWPDILDAGCQNRMIISTSLMSFINLGWTESPLFLLASLVQGGGGNKHPGVR